MPRLGFIFQTFNLVPTLDALENIELPLRLGRHRPDPAWLDEIIGTLGLRDRLHHQPSQLSGAALSPARSAARTDILHAIAHE